MLQPKQIPTTGRKVSFQIKQLGYSSLEEFAASLPQKAVVADVGAGLSRLGHTVAAARPDIVWVNIDPSYDVKYIKQEASKDLPPNVTLFVGDIVKGFALPKELRNKAGLVYSYWLLPHLSLESDAIARQACQHLFGLLRPNGRLVVGPVRRLGWGLLSPYRYKGTVTHSKTESEQEVVDDIVAKTKLWWAARWLLLFSNRHNIHIGMRFIGGKAKQ